MNEPTRWEVRFCDRCFAAYDVEPPSRRKVCDDCLLEGQHRMNAIHNGRRSQTRAAKRLQAA